jgi:chromosome partitioning protein
MKGGVGKTTTAVHVAAALASLPGQAVLLADLDAQGAVARYFQMELLKLTVAEVLQGRCGINDAARQVDSGFWVLPSDARLFGVESMLVAQHRRLDRLSEAIKATRRYSYVIIDTPPSINWAMLNALYAAQYLLIPVVLEALPVTILESYLKMIAEAIRSEGLQARLRPASIIPTFYEERTRARRSAYERLRSTFGDLIAPPIRRTVKFVEAAAAGQTIFQIAPSSKAAFDYTSVAMEILKWDQNNDNLQP